MDAGEGRFPKRSGKKSESPPPSASSPLTGGKSQGTSKAARDSYFLDGLMDVTAPLVTPPEYDWLLDPRPSTRTPNPTSQPLNPMPCSLSPKPQTLNPKY